MPYSQKYCLVSFIQPVSIGAEFNMNDWPLHITLVDVFAIERDNTSIESKISKLLSSQPPVDTRASEEATLGTTEVVLLEKAESLINLHIHLVDLLKENGAIFNSPEFTREGFLPHCTIQKTERLHARDEVTIDAIALVDMFPNGQWQQRKVINSFVLQTGHKE